MEPNEGRLEGLSSQHDFIKLYLQTSRITDVTVNGVLHVMVSSRWSLRPSAFRDVTAHVIVVNIRKRSATKRKQFPYRDAVGPLKSKRAK